MFVITISPRDNGRKWRYVLIILLFHSNVCTTVGCVPPTTGLRRWGLNGITYTLGTSKLPKLTGSERECSVNLFSACDWWNAVKTCTSCIDPSEVGVFDIPCSYSAKSRNTSGMSLTLQLPCCLAADSSLPSMSDPRYDVLCR